VSTHVFLVREAVVTFEPITGTVMKIEAATGKLVWFKTLATDKPAPILPTNSGASLWGDRLFVYGAKTAILELKSGDIQWAFDPERVKSFPVKLPDPAAPPPAATLLASSGVTPGSYGPGSYGSGSYGMSSGYAVPYSYRHVIGSLASPYSPYYPSPYYSGLNGPGGPAYLDYFHQNGAIGSGELRLVGTAVAWASLAENGVWRSGELLGGTLLLSDPGGTKLLRAGFPFGGKQVMAAGQYVGRCGRTACLLGGEVLFLIDTADGAVRHVSLQDVMHPGDPSVQVAIDGPMVYAIGVQGIAAIHARSGKRLSLEKWPKEVAPPVANGLRRLLPASILRHIGDVPRDHPAGRASAAGRRRRRPALRHPDRQAGRGAGGGHCSHGPCASNRSRQEVTNGDGQGSWVRRP
jgi:hypothetical protein